MTEPPNEIEDDDVANLARGAVHQLSSKRGEASQFRYVVAEKRERGRPALVWYEWGYNFEVVSHQICCAAGWPRITEERLRWAKDRVRRAVRGRFPALRIIGSGGLIYLVAGVCRAPRRCREPEKCTSIWKKWAVGNFERGRKMRPVHWGMEGRPHKQRGPGRRRKG